MKNSSSSASPAYETAMGREGLRLTPQRRHVYDVLMEKRDHPTATEVFLRAQRKMSSISLATVYNCLEAMVGNGLVRAVHVDREPTRYCANLSEHGHFHCTQCGKISDIDFSSRSPEGQKCTLGTCGWILPPGFIVKQRDVTLRGFCSSCGGQTMQHNLQNPTN